MAKTNEKLSELWDELTPKAKQLVMKVLKIEKEKLHMGKPLGVNDEILSAIDEVVPEE